VDIHPEDAYYDTRFSVIGLSGTVSGDLHNNEGCWFGGGFVADEGTDFYFYMASVAPVDEGPEPSDGRHSGSVVSAGAAVTILDIHPDDAYHFAGPVTCDDGSEYYFFKAAVELR